MNTDIDTAVQAVNEGTITTIGDYSGGGMFSEVYIMPDELAVKVNKCANSDAWLWWAVYCIERQGQPFIPNIHGLVVDVKEDTFVAVLDKLQDFMDDEIWADSGLWSWWTEKAYPELRAMPIPMRLYEDLEEDHNWMVNDDMEPIVTDPICYKGWRDCKGNTEDRSNLFAIMDYLKENPSPLITFKE